MDDWLKVGGLLESYIKGVMSDSPVQQLTTLSDIEQIALRGHLICVAYAGETVESDRIDTVTVTQRWLTIVSVQSASRALDARVPLSKAGPLLAKLVLAVQGQQFEGFKPLTLVTPPPPRQASAFQHFPLAWETSFICVGNGALL